MRKKDLTAPALLLEAVVILVVIGYVALQVFYGMYYHRGVTTILMNSLVMLLIYSFFTFLSIYPERVNRLPLEVCQGVIRKYTLWMVRLEKLVITIGLLIPCIFDVIGKELKPASSLILVLIMILIAFYYEGRIIHELRRDN